VQYELLAGKLNLAAEYDLSDFDADNADEISAKNDKAWNFQAGGSSGSYNYQAVYEYVGPEYQVIGNPNLLRDREGFTLTGGVQKTIHSLKLLASRYEDNVDNNELIPQVLTTTGAAEYTVNYFTTVPMGLSYQKTIMDATMIPTGGWPYKTETDMYGARINYLSGPWNVGFNANYSTLNDKTANNYDTSAQSYSFAPTYNAAELSCAPSLTFNRASDKTRDVDTDTLTATLDFRGLLYESKISYEFGGTYNRLKASDDSMLTDILNANARVAYNFRQEWAGLLNPSVGIRGLYYWTDDKVSHQDDDAYALFLVLSASMGFAF